MEMMEKMMESAIQALENSTRTADTSADAVVVQLPFVNAKAQIARTGNACETLRQGIGTMQQGLKVLAGLVGGIDDCVTREKLQHQLDSISGLLLLRLDQLSSIDHLLQLALDRTRRPR